jgi:ParB-like chromosome segregation protein Spo0J
MGTSHERGTARIADLKEAPYNPRRISKEALAGLRASLDRWGLVQEIVVNRRTGHIVGGHQRVAAMRLAGEAEAPVVWVDLPMKEEKALNVALNNPHISGEFSDDLAAILEEVREHDAAMFEAVRLDALMEAVPTTPDLDPEPQMGGLEYRIVVDCESESHQALLLERMEKEGLQCRALIS